MQETADDPTRPGDGGVQPPHLKVHDPDEDDGDDGGDDATATTCTDVNAVWFKLLHEFTETKLPPLGAYCKPGLDDPNDRVPPAVRQAQDLAIIAAFRAIERLCDGVAPEAEISTPILILGAGRDQ